MSTDERSGHAKGDGVPAGREHGQERIDGSSDAPSARAKPPSFPFQPAELEAFRGTGHELIPLHAPNALDARGRSIGKAPHKGWPKANPLSIDEGIAHMRAGGNVGVRLRSTDLVVDVDPRNFVPGDDPSARLQRDLGIRLSDFPEVVTGSGGRHFYMRIPAGLPVCETAEGYQGIEFKTHGRQVGAPGSVHPETFQPYTWDGLTEPLSATGAAPDALLELIRRPDRGTADEPGEVSSEQLAAMLDGLDPGDFRDHAAWFELMCACHHATGGAGRDEFVAWSISDPNYADHAAIVVRRWESLHADSGGRRVTARTLYKRLIDAGRGELIPRDSAEDDFPDDLPDAPAAAGSAEAGRCGLADEWVWIAEIERFVRRTDTRKFSEKQFKSMFQHRWSEGNICEAVWKGKLPIRRIEALTYVPSQPEFVVEGEWAGCYNLWRPSGVEPKVGDVGVFLEHMEYLFPDAVEREHVLDYLSLLVSPTFVKVNFALLIRGRPGTGKSFLGKLVRKMIGGDNVSMPSSTEVTKEFTGWQEGVQLAILEELMAIGKVEVANRLKPVITDDFLRIRLMHTNAYSTPNFLNLLCFTNHEDALPIEAGDRRWLVVFSDAAPRDEAYYERLFSMLSGDGPAAVKHFLQQRRIGLNPKGVAPTTRGKAEMRQLSLGEAEQHLAELLEEGAVPFDFDLVKLDDVVDAVPATIQRQSRNLRNRIAKWLKEEVGATRFSRYTKQDGSGRPAIQLWAVRDQARWEEAGAAARIDAFLARAKVI
jgi:hypothetical protein